MLTLASLSAGELRRRLATDGIHVQTGPFVMHVQSALANVADGIGLMYADYPLLEHAQFADFHLTMRSGSAWRRWLRPQVHFDQDGHAPFKPLPQAQAFPMLEWSMNWCISSRAHEFLILHAAVVERGGRAAILPAPAGSGKSTLCAALVSRGWRLLSDELAVIRPADGQLIPVPRPISLKNASIELIRRYAPASVISAPVADTSKGTVAHVKAPADSVRRAAETALPAWIVFPKYEADAAPCLTPLEPARGFIRVAENGFNYSLLGAAGFDTLAGLIDATALYDFRYSLLDDAIAVFERLAESAR